MKEPIESRLKTVADNIRKLRLNRQYSQDYVAYKLKISQNSYSKIELGRTKVTLYRIFQIAHVLEIDIASLISIKIGEM